MTTLPGRHLTRCLRVLAAALLTLLTACGQPRLEPLDAGATVLAFGDSLTRGTGAGSGQSYPAVLAELTGLAVVNAGIPGEVSAAGRERLPDLLAEHTPDLVVLVHGGNDALRKIPPEQTRDNLAAMIAASRAAGAQVVMLGVPGRNLTLSTPGFYDDVADRLKVPMDGSTLPELMRDRSLKSDPVHFNAAGYARMAEAVRALLRGAGALPGE